MYFRMVAQLAPPKKDVSQSNSILSYDLCETVFGKGKGGYGVRILCGKRKTQTIYACKKIYMHLFT